MTTKPPVGRAELDSAEGEVQQDVSQSESGGDLPLDVGDPEAQWQEDNIDAEEAGGADNEGELSAMPTCKCLNSLCGAINIGVDEDENSANSSPDDALRKSKSGLVDGNTDSGLSGFDQVESDEELDEESRSKICRWRKAVCPGYPLPEPKTALAMSRGTIYSAQANAET